MNPRKIVRLLSIAAICWLSLLACPIAGHSEERTIPVRLPPENQADSSLKLLEGFAVIPGSAVLVQGGYVIALFKKPQNDLYALVSFRADCDVQGCTVKELVTYALFGVGRTAPLFSRA